MSTPSTPASSPQLPLTSPKQATGTEITTQWPSYNNFSKLCTEFGSGKRARMCGGICGLFSRSVTVTEKLDGSNLGMWVRHNPLIGSDKKDMNTWEVLLLQGRNLPIWRRKGFDEFAERAAASAENGNSSKNKNNNSKKTTKKQQQKIRDDDVGEGENGQQQEADPFDAELSKKLYDSLQDDLKYMSTALPNYGHPKTLGRLVYKMREFCVNVANALDVNEIEIFGEAFRAKTITQVSGGSSSNNNNNNNNNNNDDDDDHKISSPQNGRSGPTYMEMCAKYASWHPFGYKDPKNWEITRLVAATHELFSRFVILPPTASASVLAAPPKTHDELIKYLMTAQDHSVFPPPLYAPANIKLIDAVTAIIPVMVNPPERAFEGVFVVAENGDFACKFKTGTHDEQKQFPSMKDIGVIESDEALQAAIADQDKILAKNPNFASTPGFVDFDMMKKVKVIFGIMNQIFVTKIEAPVIVNGAFAVAAATAADAAADAEFCDVEDANWNRVQKIINGDVNTACERELGKRLSFAHFAVGSKERQQVVDELVPLVIKEVVHGYEESDDLKMPYTKEFLAKRAVFIVKSIVDNVPFKEIGCE